MHLLDIKVHLFNKYMNSSKTGPYEKSDNFYMMWNAIHMIMDKRLK